MSLRYGLDLLPAAEARFGRRTSRSKGLLEFAVSTVAVWSIYPLAYYVVASADRYRCPILWTSLVPAGYALAALAPAFQRLLKTSPAH